MFSKKVEELYSNDTILFPSFISMEDVKSKQMALMLSPIVMRSRYSLIGPLKRKYIYARKINPVADLQRNYNGFFSKVFVDV